MEEQQLNWIANFIWGIADDILRDNYVRGKYRDVILPMTVIRRLDVLLEPNKKDVLDMRAMLDRAGITNQDAALRQAAGQAFYNTSPFTLRDLKAKGKHQQLKLDFEAYLDGFSPNVIEILEKFKFRSQIDTLVEADILGSLIEKFLDSKINLSPNPVHEPDGSIKLPGLDNHAMGTIFEELIRKFNEENNEEAGEHFTPRDVVKLMTNLIFLPIADKIESGTYLVYDGACGTGGMLTIAEETLLSFGESHQKEIAIHLYGQEVNPETFAISKADLLIKGEGDQAENMKFGSTLSSDAYPTQEFDFMLSNPPYGKSWKTDLERMGGKGEMNDLRFVIEHGGDPEYSLITRSSDGQMIFLVNMLSKMKHDSPLGSRIAEVHNGSSLFTGDAGSGESNIRRWIIENDWLEAIIALPFNIFYNTGIATYIWVLTNRKAEHRRGKVQLIDATPWFQSLRKNLGKKNCELSPDDITRITDACIVFAESEQSKIFPNEAFGFWKVTVERPLRLKVDLSEGSLKRFKEVCIQAKEEALILGHGKRFRKENGPGPHLDYNQVMSAVESTASHLGVKMLAKRWKLIETSLAEKDELASPVIKKVHKTKVNPDPLRGLFPAIIDGKAVVVEYESDSELRDTEQIPLLEDGGIDSFIRREVLPHVPDAWIDESGTKIGYEISFTRYFAEETSRRIGKKYRLQEILLNNVIINVISQKKIKHKYIPFEEHPDAVYLPVTGKRNAITSLNKIPEGRSDYLQLIINRDIVYPEYFAYYLNTILGYGLRDMLMVGTTISRISIPTIRSSKISIYLDNLQGQQKTIKALQKLEVLKSELSEIESRIDDRSKKIDAILDDLDHINHEELFKDWVETLPFPLASILRAYYTVDQNDREKYERLLFFFEALSVFYATIHISACRPIPEIWDDARATISNLLKKQHLTLISASFGVWKIIIEVLTSTIRKGFADKERSDYYSRIYRVNNPIIIEKLCSVKLVQIIQDSNKYRNRWKGHGGSISPSEAKYRHQTLLALLNDYRGDIGTLFLNYLLIEPNVGRTLPGPIHQYNIRKIIGSNILMETDTITLTEPVVSDQLCFYCPDHNRALMLDKFFLMRNTPQPACYFL